MQCLLLKSFSFFWKSYCVTQISEQLQKSNQFRVPNGRGKLKHKIKRTECILKSTLYLIFNIKNNFGFKMFLSVLLNSDHKSVWFTTEAWCWKSVEWQNVSYAQRHKGLEAWKHLKVWGSALKWQRNGKN